VPVEVNVYPLCLYRAFGKEGHAKEFVELGRFRLGSLKGYRETEKKCIQDATEGFSHWKDSRGINGGFIEVYPVYLLCASGPSVDLSHLRKKYGRWVVRIGNPSKLLEQLSVSTPVNTTMALSKTIEFEKVSYTKDETIPAISHDSPDAVKLAYTQKSARFQADCEYRYVVRAKTAGGSPAGCLHYDLGGPMRYLELLEVDNLR